MFINTLRIENDGNLIREVAFQKGINLIVDETQKIDKKTSGNDVGKTTVLRLIDYCLGGDGKNIYQDPEFKKKKNVLVEQFLKNNNITITLNLRENLDSPAARELVIKRNFLGRKRKIQEIDGIEYGNDDFTRKLKELIFGSRQEKPSFRQIIAKNIRDEKNRLVNTIKVLHPTTKPEEYEPLYLFWLGIDIDTADRKQKLFTQRKIEENLQRRLRQESTLAQVEQSLVIIKRTISELESKKDKFGINEAFDKEIVTLNQVKSYINSLTTKISGLQLRKELINESKNDLEKDKANIDVEQVSRLYYEAKTLIPDLQKTYEETLLFHNSMVDEKVRYITKELPEVEKELFSMQKKLNELLTEEKDLANRLKKSETIGMLQETIIELNKNYEKKGQLEEKKKMWEDSKEKLKSIETELLEINSSIISKDSLIKERVEEFNKYFSSISSKLYGEQFVLSPDKNNSGYELNIGTIHGNPGTGKKKGEMAAFDLAYIQFADALNIDCLHFILQDQMENVHDNQISELLTEIVNQMNCQYVLPVLKDKLPEDIDVKPYEILTLSQNDKLLKI